jgi:hypothetical protein
MRDTIIIFLGLLGGVIILGFAGAMIGRLIEWSFGT